MLKFGDFSVFQGTSQAYFQQLHNLGSRGAMVKLTEGINYVNPSAGPQMRSALKVFKVFGVYHYFLGMPVRESKFFLHYLKAYGIDKTTRLAIDVEDQSLPAYPTSLINKFLDELYNAGYHNLAVYGSAYWMNSGKINLKNIVHHASIWVADYGVAKPGVERYNAWQYTDSWHGIDQSIDYSDHFTRPSEQMEKPTYWHKGKQFKIKSKSVKVYADMQFKHWTGDTLDEGSVVAAKPVKFGKKGVYRLKRIDAFGYISGNIAWTYRIK